jgi:predicted dehydrogenase
MTPILKAGMVGLDTSHCQAFIEVLHDPANPYHVPGVQVTGVYAGGSAQFSLSRDRVKQFSTEIDSRFHIPAYENIPDLVKDVDVLFLTSVDGRQHLEQFNQMAAGKPVFIDKPFAVTTADAVSIIARAASTGTPVMSCSALRFAQGIRALAQSRDDILACEVYGPAPILPDYPGFFWYGIHSAEILFLLLGGDCQSVRTVTANNMDVISAAWLDGRSGLVLGTHFEGYEFGCLVHRPSGAHLGIAQNTPPYHACLVNEIVRFFQSGQSPVDIRETYQIIAFLEAANQSKIENGAPISLSPLPAWN